MKRFGLGKKKDSDEGSDRRFFGRRSNPQDKEAENPYAQSQDPYSNYSQPPAAPVSNGPPRAGGLPSGPRGGYAQTPPPPYPGGAQAGAGAGSRYGNEKVGATSGYGANRYDANSSSSNSYQNNAPQRQQRAGGYGGLGPTDGPDDNRDALLSGAKPTYVGQNNQGAAGSGQYGQYGQSGQSTVGGSSYGGYGEQRELTEEEKEEQEIQDVKSQINQVRNESVLSTQNSLRTADAAIETALGTYNMLGQQKERFYNIQHNFNQASAASREAEKKTRDLEKANGSMWNPANYGSKKRNNEKRIQNQLDYEEDKAQRESTRREQYESNMQFQKSQQEIGQARQLGRGTSNRGDKSKFLFEDGDDDEDAGFQRQQEDMIDDNIDQIGQRVGVLNQVARAMGKEVEEHNQIISKLDEDANRLDNGVNRLRLKLGTIK